ncbi:hypothetical protein PUN28_005788 [Cardiocondyla obscurior]|uniref:RING finger protein 17 n=1 Tax=Cardiocondyla obscurior TaxID=286306 RepID=A0AAW2G8F0_9HYME
MDIPSVKMSRKRQAPPCYRVPDIKLRNVICVCCKKKFYVPDLSNLNGMTNETLIPLLLDCGHPICDKCISIKIIKKCPSCNKNVVINNQNFHLPLNIYGLGLIISSNNRFLEYDDEQFLFCPNSCSQTRQISKQGNCHECGTQANINCPQCMVLYCYDCYSKIHGKALQNHTQIPIYDGTLSNPGVIFSRCSSKCSEMLKYFCKDCNMACCSNCTLCSHKMHDYVPISQKNETLLPELNETFVQIEETLLRVCETKEKIKSAISSNTDKIENRDDTEASISQHFAHLHGILQNMEANLINQLHKPNEGIKKNLADLKMQLQMQEEKLNLAMQIATYAKNTFHKIDIQSTITILKEMINVPCHLMYKDECTKNENVTFNVDDSIISAIENHCSVQVPSVSSYSLVKKDELPESYLMSSFTKKLRASCSKFKVEIVSIHNPSLFFIRKAATKSIFLQLEKDLMTYGENQTVDVETSLNIKQDDKCIVRQMKGEWFRGYVKAVNATKNGETYNVYYLDYGNEECNIPVSRVQRIPEHLEVLPPQAIQCSLHGVAPKSFHWTDASTNDFKKLLNEADCTVSVIESTSDILYVDLCFLPKNSNMGPQSMCTTMIVMDHARLNTCQSSNQILNSTYVYTEEDVIFNKKLIVKINVIQSPNEIYFIKAQRERKLMKLQNNLAEYYKHNTSVIKTPQEGLPCAVQLKDNNWYRGEITEIINETEVKVFFVDCGQTNIQHRDTLEEIPYEFTLLRAQSIKYSLMYIMPEPDGSWKPEATELIKAMTINSNCIFVYPQRKTIWGYSGIMYIDNQDVSRYLKEVGVVNYYHPKFKNRSNKKLLKPVYSSLDKSVETVNDFTILLDNTLTENNKSKDETSKDSFKVEVCIQRVTTPDCIFVAQTECATSITNLLDSMQKFYNNYISEKRDKWNEGTLCTAYSAKDKSYFRAKILKIKSPIQVDVYFYDVGIEETVTLNDIQALHPNFSKEKTYCFKVKLAGILPCGGSSIWPSLSCSTLSEIIRNNTGCKFYITKPVKEEFCDDAVPVELWVRQLKIPGPLAPAKVEINSINRMLVEAGVALPIKNYFVEADSTLAAEFKQQLENNCSFMPFEEDVKWNPKVMNENDTVNEMDNPLLFKNNTFCNTNNDMTTLNHHECTKLSEWLQPIEITEEVFYAIPTYVDNQCVVHLHSKNHNAIILQYIESKLQTYSKKIKINKEKQWKEGELCIAKYHYNQKWYRGKVVKVSEHTVQVKFVDYGNVEECEMDCLTDEIILTGIPIQCTKCVISGIKPEKSVWQIHDLDRFHALLVEKECKITVLQREDTHLLIAITLLQPWKCDFLVYVANHVKDTNVIIDRKEWNDSINSENKISLSWETTKDVVVEETLSEYDNSNVADTSNKSLLDTCKSNVTLNENMISGNMISLKTDKSLEDKQTSDIESISSIDTINLPKKLICSTPQLESEEEDCLFSYKQLIIPQKTKYIELILCCNRDPITSYAQLAENKDDIFSNELHNYYLQYTDIMAEIQTDTCRQPLIQNFEKNTPCIAKFTDDSWYRCIITNIEETSNPQYDKISLYYVDFGNHEEIMLDIFSNNYNLHVPKEEWLKLPAMAIKCTFWGLNFASDDIFLLASRLNEIYNQVVVARIKEIINGNNLVVEIYKDKTCEELFYANLIEEGLYKFEEAEKDSH